MNIFCVGRNYVDHAKELGNQVPDEPVIFIKPESALLPSGLPMAYPSFTNDLHYECELVLRLCKNGKNIEAEQAAGYYSEVTLGIDFTARDVQDKLKKKGLPWEKAKAFDQSAALGKYLPASAFPDMQNIRFRFYKNGELVQQGHTADMLFPVPVILADISKYFSVNIGDLIFTGTPQGVGACCAGDLLEGYLEDEKVLSVTII